jgi:mRNA interferase HigB
LHVISRKMLAEFALGHPDAETAPDAWYRIVKKSRWRHFVDVRRVYPHADAVGKWIVFNIRGNRYRLIAEVNFRNRIVFVRRILTHSEYDGGDWKI